MRFSSLIKNNKLLFLGIIFLFFFLSLFGQVSAACDPDNYDCSSCDSPFLGGPWWNWAFNSWEAMNYCSAYDEMMGYPSVLNDTMCSNYYGYLPANGVGECVDFYIPNFGSVSCSGFDRYGGPVTGGDACVCNGGFSGWSPMPCGMVGFDPAWVYNFADPFFASGSGGGGGGDEGPADITTGLVAHYYMDDTDGTTVADTEGNDGTGTYTPSDGIVGGALSFNGSSEWITLGAPEAFDLGTGDFSFAFWMKAPTNGYAGLIGNRVSSINDNFINITTPNNGYITLETASTYNSPLISNGPLTDDAWHHVVIVRDAGTLNMYVDGVLQASTITGNTDNIYSSTANMRLGQYYTDLNDYPYNGLMDDVRVYNRGLSSTDVEDLYGSGPATICDATCSALREGLVGYWPFDFSTNDQSASNITTTNYGGVIGSENGKVNNGIFLSSGSYIDGGNPPEVNFSAVPFSVAAWVKTSSNSFVVDKGNSGANKNYDLMYDGGTGNIMFLWYNGWYNNMGAFYSGGLESPADWHYIVGTWDGTYAKVYADGVLKQTSEDLTNYQPASFSENLFFGARRGSYNDYYLNGNLDEVAIWDRMLEPEEVLDLYNEGNGRSLAGDAVLENSCEATGGTITEVGDYKIHTFTADGTFTVSSDSCNVETLVVAGGGGGGSDWAGGGGAGGLIHSTEAVSSGEYPVVVGAGGPPISNGDDSFFGDFLAKGGGAGANGGGGAGANGGSGGGGAGSNGDPSGGLEIQTVTGYGVGYNGGRGINDVSPWPNAGGGGAGAEGGNGVIGSAGGGGAGGAGLEFDISGALTYYAGGGGGGDYYGNPGLGGSGVGGNGGANGEIAGNGAPNTGSGGGGGGGGGSTGGSGGSGVVIIRYSTTGVVSGCMDPLANNYNELATVDDESCAYSILVVGKTGTQITTAMATSTDQDMGGAFSLLTGGDLTVDSIKIKQIGSFPDADIENIRLYYKQQNTCSATKPADADEFDTIDVLDENGEATSTGSLSLTAASTTCLYIVYDLTGTPGTSTLGRSIDFEITNPQTDILVTGGTVSTTDKVNIAGLTIITNNDVLSLLSLHMRDETKNPTLFYLQNNAVWKQEGANNPIRLTNPNLQVHNLVLTDMGGGFVRIEITISNMDPGQEGTFLNVTRTLKTTAGVRAWDGTN
jgi:hypothetical protein